MERDDEIRNENSAQPVEKDLFSITEPNETTAGTPPEAPLSPEPPSPAEPVREPEFKINESDHPEIRMLHEKTPAATGEGSASKPSARKVTLHTEADATLGTMLTEARKAAGLSIPEVNTETKIRVDYIEALEQDRTDALPNLVFLRAYVRALILHYNLDDPSTQMIEQQLKELEPAVEVPKKLIEDIGREVQINESETRKLKMILIYGSIILLLLISLTVTSIISVHIRNSRRQAERLRQADRPFESSQLEPLLPPQLPKPQMLPVPSPSDAQMKNR